MAGGGAAHVVGLFLALLGTTTETKDEVERGFLLNVVVAQCATIFELLACEDQALLVGGNATMRIIHGLNTHSVQMNKNIPLLVLDLGLDIIYGV